MRKLREVKIAQGERCPKVSYGTSRKAHSAQRLIMRAGKSLRCYRCNRCGKYHLTSKAYYGNN